MKKTFLVILAFVGLVALSCAVTKTTGGDGHSSYKNLKVLPKDITHEQMDSVMHHFTGSLNVKCNFCHVRNEEKKEMDWAADDNKHKLVARQMLTMTNDLNKKYFNLTGSAMNISTPLMVTCFTCHHGSTEPSTNPPKQERPQQRPPQDTTKRNG
ncbi:c-type cytochrome [Flavisolibacter nicotianae]|uniref:c-type cytochrome n=1 Tax=Flavisolibacter nicotianae TaxID=2364882 RepID=UPI000EB0D06C|nr:c-type cytochrome [Flavisolibacter nicotianae]